MERRWMVQLEYWNGRYKSKCPAWKRNLLSLMQDDRYHFRFLFICLPVQAIRKSNCISFSLLCRLLPVTSSHCITTVAGTLKGIDSFWGLSLRKRQMSHESKNALKHSVNLLKLRKCISSYGKEVSISRGTTWKVIQSSGCYKET